MAIRLWRVYAHTMETQIEAFVNAWLRDNTALLDSIVADYLWRAKIRSCESKVVADLKGSSGCDS
jgi:hypothetical protein